LNVLDYAKRLQKLYKRLSEKLDAQNVATTMFVDNALSLEELQSIQSKRKQPEKAAKQLLDLIQSSQVFCCFLSALKNSGDEGRELYKLILNDNCKGTYADLQRHARLPTTLSAPLSHLTFIPFLTTTPPHVLYALQTRTCCPFLMFALHLPPVVSMLQPSLGGTRSHLAFATLPLPIPFVAFLKLTASSRLLASPSGSPKCLRFGLSLTLCTINILFTYLLTYMNTHRYSGLAIRLVGIGWTRGSLGRSSRRDPESSGEHLGRGRAPDG